MQQGPGTEKREKWKVVERSRSRDSLFPQQRLSPPPFRTSQLTNHTAARTRHQTQQPACSPFRLLVSYPSDAVHPATTSSLRPVVLGRVSLHDRSQW